MSPTKPWDRREEVLSWPRRNASDFGGSGVRDSRAFVLLREQDDGVLAIGQASHAWVSGQLARAWGNDRWPRPAPREEVCLGAEQHDVGMSQWDLRPSLNPATGRPYTFMEMPVAVHVGLWMAAPAKLLSQSRYAALLVSMHGTALSERRDLTKLAPDERKLVAEYRAAHAELQRTLARQVGADAQELARNQRLVWTWDSISLALCLRWPTVTLERVPAPAGPVQLRLESTAPDRFTLTPWPLATPEVEVHCEGRLLERCYETEAQLHRALDRAPSVNLAFTLCAA